MTWNEYLHAAATLLLFVVLPLAVSIRVVRYASRNGRLHITDLIMHIAPPVVFVAVGSQRQELLDGGFALLLMPLSLVVLSLVAFVIKALLVDPWGPSSRKTSAWLLGLMTVFALVLSLTVSGGYE